MPKTLLAVDDSVTMRKVLEITFSGDDFRVITAENAQGAISKAGEADAVVIDASLGNDEGYALAKQVRQARPNAAILLLASRYAPYDQAKGRDAGADDFEAAGGAVEPHAFAGDGRVALGEDDDGGSKCRLCCRPLSGTQEFGLSDLAPRTTPYMAILDSR